jgi:uncharacterized protein YhhL (DUF1145 family)
LLVAAAVDLALKAQITAAVVARAVTELLVGFLLLRVLHIPSQWEPEALRMLMVATVFLVLLHLLEAAQAAV